MESTLNYGKNAKSTHMTSDLYYLDAPNPFGDTQGGVNKGLKRRRDIIKEIKEMDMMGAPAQ